MKKILFRSLMLAVAVALCGAASAHAQKKAIGFKTGNNFSDGVVAGNTLYVAGQQGPAANGKLDGLDITAQTTNALNAVMKVVKDAGFAPTDIVSVTVYVANVNDVPAMNAVYGKMVPDPKPARATVQVAALIGGAKIEIAAIAVKTGARMTPMSK